MRPASFHRPAGRLLLLVLGGAVAGAVATEGLARALYPRFTTRAARFGMGPDSDLRFRPSSVLGWEARSSPKNPVDQDGFMSLHGAAPRSRDEWRLLIVGDSVAVGMLRSRETLAAWEDALKRALSKRVALWRFAVGGYGLGHYEKILRFKAPRMGPDAVVVVFCLNDIHQRNIPVVWEDDGKLFVAAGNRMAQDRTVWPGLFARSHAYRALWLFRNRRRVVRESGDAAEGLDDALVRNKALFLRMAAWCRDRNVRFYAVVFPYIKPLERYGPKEGRGYAELARWLAEAEVPFLDLHEKLDMRGWKDYRQENLPEDEIHPNERGYREARAHILEFLVREEERRPTVR